MLRLTNTLTGEREPFEPADPEAVTLYYCGLTTSDPAHLGHARGWVVVDVLHRWLDHEGYGVRHVENFTDVNEKIVARVGQDGDSERAVADHYTASIIEDMRGLNLLRADVYPRASEHVPEMVALVEDLIERGHAYESEGSVYFDVTTFEGYGRLSNQRPEDLEAQGDPDERAEKRHPADFALWKAGGVDPEAVAEHRHDDHPGWDGDPPTGQTWSSPWGEGRPGWHVECSAMSTAHLGETIDVHVGGRDLVFPHHENEIAQSEGATGEQFVRHWLHQGMLEVDDEKMSSSERNFTTVADALEEYGPDVLRTFLLGAAYGSRLTLSSETVAEAEDRFDRLERAHDRATAAADSVDAYATVTDPALQEAVDDARERFPAAMDDDLNTREALSVLSELASSVLAHDEAGPPYDYRGLKRAIDALEEFGGDVLGLSLGAPAGGAVGLADDLVETLLSVRERHREAGDYEAADRIRDRLQAVGVEVEDADDGPRYRLP